jgi:HD-GYP domain-containing protein (c-di-GMP phosphodiesterase class II)
MKSHPVRSAEMVGALGELEFFLDVMSGVLHHHERIDGLGYPFGLRGDEIPVSSRIVLVTDTFDAMTSNRSYRKGVASEVAYEELLRCAGKQFDPYFVKLFINAHKFWENGRQYKKAGSMAEEVWLKTA